MSDVRNVVMINVGLTGDVQAVYQKVAEERARQHRMFIGSWGDVRQIALQNPHRCLSILMEEVGEVARALNDESEISIVAFELYQVAAVSIAWLNAIEERLKAQRPQPGADE